MDGNLAIKQEPKETEELVAPSCSWTFIKARENESNIKIEKSSEHYTHPVCSDGSKQLSDIVKITGSNKVTDEFCHVENTGSTDSGHVDQTCGGREIRDDNTDAYTDSSDEDKSEKGDYSDKDKSEKGDYSDDNCEKGDYSQNNYSTGDKHAHSFTNTYNSDDNYGSSDETLYSSGDENLVYEESTDPFDSDDSPDLLQKLQNINKNKQIKIDVIETAENNVMHQETSDIHNFKKISNSEKSEKMEVDFENIINIGGEKCDIYPTGSQTKTDNEFSNTDTIYSLKQNLFMSPYQKYLKNRSSEKGSAINKKTSVSTPGCRPYKCLICKDRFKSRSQLNKHALIHSANKKSYSCLDCNKHFFVESEYKSHMEQKECFTNMNDSKTDKDVTTVQNVLADYTNESELVSSHNSYTQCQNNGEGEQNNAFTTQCQNIGQGVQERELTTQCQNIREGVQHREFTTQCQYIGQGVQHREFITQCQNIGGKQNKELTTQCQNIEKGVQHREFATQCQNIGQGVQERELTVHCQNIGEDEQEKNLTTQCQNIAEDEQERDLTTQCQNTGEDKQDGELPSQCQNVGHGEQDGESTTLFPCDVCSRKFQFKTSLNRHYLEKHNSYLHSKKQLKMFHPDTDRKKAVFKCDLCDRVFKLMKYLKQHYKSHREMAPYKCDSCESSFFAEYNLQQHKQTHSLVRETTASNPLITDSSIQEANSSTSVDKKINSYRCGICGRQFTSKRALERHANAEHIDNNSYKCKYCDELFVTSDDFNQHMKVHKSFKCSLCTKVFKSETAMEKHVRVQHPVDSPYTCIVCGKGFFAKYNLSQHLQEHGIDVKKQNKIYNIEDKQNKDISSGIQQNKCDESTQHEESKKQQINVEQTDIEQTDIDQNNVDQINEFCEKKLQREIKSCILEKHDIKSRKSLNKHVDNHLRNSPFENFDNQIINSNSQQEQVKCKYCKKEFSSKKSKNHHVSIQHSEECHFSCQTCQRGFFKKSFYLNHMKKHERDLLTCDRINVQTDRTEIKHKIRTKTEKVAMSSSSGNAEINTENQCTALMNANKGEIDIINTGKGVTDSFEKQDKVAQTYDRITECESHKCSKCLKRFNAKLKLKKHCQTKHSECHPIKHSKHHQIKHSKHHSIKYSEYNQIKHLEQSSTNDSELCGKGSYHQTNLQTHINVTSAILVKEETFTCDWCNHRFKSGALLNKHLSDCDKSKLSISDRPSDSYQTCSNTKSSSDCLVNRDYTNHQEQQYKSSHKKLDSSMNNKTSLKSCIKCEICYKMFDTKKNMQTHFRKKHAEYTPYQCKICVCGFAREHNYLIHMQKYHDKEIREINQSKLRIMNNKQDMENTQYIGENKDFRNISGESRDLIWPEKEKNTTEDKILLTHKVTDEQQKEIKRNEDKVCWREISEKHLCQDEEHKKICENKEEQNMDVNTVNGRQENLNKNQDTINTDICTKKNIKRLKFKCNLCPRWFISKKLKQIHCRSHVSKLAPFICRVCGYGFFFEPHFEKHVYNHDSFKPITLTEKSLSCSKSNRVLKNKAALERHVKKHGTSAKIHQRKLKGKKLECKLCSKDFWSGKTFKKHVCFSKLKISILSNEKTSNFNEHREIETKLVSEMEHSLSGEEPDSVVGVNQKDNRELQSHVKTEIYKSDTMYNTVEQSVQTTQGMTANTLHSPQSTDTKPETESQNNSQQNLLGQLTNKVSQVSPEKSKDAEYKCSICQIGFIYKQNLDNHLLMHKVKLHSCSICHKKFKHYFVMQRHVYKRHSNVDNTVVASSGVGSSGVAFLGVGNSGVASSGVGSSGVASSGVSSSGVASSGVSSSGVASSGVGSSHVGSSGVGSSGVASSCVNQSYIASVVSRVGNNNTIIRKRSVKCLEGNRTQKFITATKNSKLLTLTRRKRQTRKKSLEKDKEHLRANKTNKTIKQGKEQDMEYQNNVEATNLPNKASYVSSDVMEKPFICNICENGFCTHNELDTHILIHNKEDLYKCGFCGKAFSRIENMTKHIKNHRMKKKEDKFTCTMCNKTFSTSKMLKHHMTHDHHSNKAQNHHGDRTYNQKHDFTHCQNKSSSFKCDICNKTFGLMATLKRHYSSHLNKRQYQCKICGQSFNRKDNCKIHERRHSEQLVNLTSC